MPADVAQWRGDLATNVHLNVHSPPAYLYFCQSHRLEYLNVVF
jgi:hypothetical protein